MPKSSDAAFNMFVSWLVPSGTETQLAKQHRQSIKNCLEKNYGMTSFFRAGSFGHGTSVRGYSDVDYFAVIPTRNLNNNSSLTLTLLKASLDIRFPSTGVYVDSPAVAVPFGTTDAEKHEITPVNFVKKTNGQNVYEMPDRFGGWMLSSPIALNSYVNYQNVRLNSKAKNLIRLIKAWNYYSGAGIRSIYLELRVAEYLSRESSILYPYDVYGALNYLCSKGLAAMNDPTGLGARIHPCTDAKKVTALSKLNTARTRAWKALEEHKKGNYRQAIHWWNMLYYSEFPGYY